MMDRGMGKKGELWNARARHPRYGACCDGNLARPGGNLTGLSNLTPELVGKGLEQLKQGPSRT